MAPLSWPEGRMDSQKTAEKTAGASADPLISPITRNQDLDTFKEQHWKGNFQEYLHLAQQNPRVTRTSFQRIYDMVLAAGSTEYSDSRKKITHYHFFDDATHGGRDA